MKNFDARWQACAARARTATRRDEAAPFGLAGRVVARAGLATTAAPTEFLWERHVARWLAGSVAVLLCCAVLELPHWRDRQPLETGIENAVAQLVWAL